MHLEVRAQLAWPCARAICEEASRRDAIGAGLPPLEVVGEFTVPPHGARRRDFQALHLDFGLPIAPNGRIDVARFTALHVDPGRAPTASTRIVPLRRLLAQRRWDATERIAERLRGYGDGGVEGILGRLVEAADGSPSLPRPDAGFLCGTEFDSLAGERAHFAARGLDLGAAEQLVRLGPGELLVFDNLATAHGRRGVREPLELHQLCLGHPGLDVSDQAILLGRVLAVFDGVPSTGRSRGSARSSLAYDGPATRRR